jgi:hypothetical protein
MVEYTVLYDEDHTARRNSRSFGKIRRFGDLEKAVHFAHRNLPGVVVGEPQESDLVVIAENTQWTTMGDSDLTYTRYDLTSCARAQADNIIKSFQEKYKDRLKKVYVGSEVKLW